MPKDRPLLDPNEYHSPYHTTLTTHEVTTLRHATKILARLASKAEEPTFREAGQNIDKIILNHTIGGALQREEPSYKEDTRIAQVTTRDGNPVYCKGAPWHRPQALMYQVVTGPHTGKRGHLAHIGRLDGVGKLWEATYSVDLETGNKVP